MSVGTGPRTATLPGFLLAIGSAASFALSGIFASSLISAGWTAGAAATLRISIAAVVLAPPTLWMLRGRWADVWRSRRQILVFALLAIVACQLAFFFAVQFIPPSLALLIEFLGPVLLIFWSWSRTRIAPSRLTLVGAGIAVAGLVTISGIAAGGSLHPLGIMFALIAAVGVAAYFATSANSNHGIPPLPFVGLGFMVSAIALSAVSVTGVLPFTVTDEQPIIAGAALPTALVVLALALISTVLAYILGVSAARRLGATVASFTGYSEALFGIFWTITLLSIVPTGLQWVGAGLIVLGVVTVKLGELRR